MDLDAILADAQSVLKAHGPHHPDIGPAVAALRTWATAPRRDPATLARIAQALAAPVDACPTWRRLSDALQTAVDATGGRNTA